MDRAIKTIKTIPYICIASVGSEGQPWNTPVFAAFDKEFNFYWGSDKESQHSRNIKANKNIFIVIFDSSATTSEGEGTYIKAIASEIKNKQEIDLAFDLLSKRDAGFVEYWTREDIGGKGPIRMYKAVPDKIWINDGQKKGGIYVDIRKEVKL